MGARVRAGAQGRAQTHRGDRGSSARTARSRVPLQAPLHLPRRCGCLPHISRPRTTPRRSARTRRRLAQCTHRANPQPSAWERRRVSAEPSRGGRQGLRVGGRVRYPERLVQPARIAALDHEPQRRAAADAGRRRAGDGASPAKAEQRRASATASLHHCPTAPLASASSSANAPPRSRGGVGGGAWRQRTDLSGMVGKNPLT
eukprot:SAG11_NODE_2215_length_3680_cov_7.703993_2_plen_202_part_00